MRSRKIGENFGVEFYDIDVSRITDQELQRAREAQNENGVIFFRNQNLSCEQHIEFAKRWGEIEVNRFFERVDGYEEIAMVRKEPHHKTVVGENWHTDHSYDIEPAKGSILYSREIPTKGGDTKFVNMYLAYETLQQETQEKIGSLEALHSSRHVFSEEAVQDIEPGEDRFHSADQAVQDSIHPMVITHPESGKKALYVNPGFTVSVVGLDNEESEQLLNQLYDHTLKPENMIRFKWQKNCIAFWDNRATWHQADNDYPTERRVMHRITLKGCPLSR